MMLLLFVAAVALRHRFDPTDAGLPAPVARQSGTDEKIGFPGQTQHGSHSREGRVPFTDASCCLAEASNHQHAADAARRTNPAISAHCGRPVLNRVPSAAMERQ